MERVFDSWIIVKIFPHFSSAIHLNTSDAVTNAIIFFNYVKFIYINFIVKIYYSIYPTPFFWNGVSSNLHKFRS